MGLMLASLSSPSEARPNIVGFSCRPDFFFSGEKDKSKKNVQQGSGAKRGVSMEYDRQAQGGIVVIKKILRDWNHQKESCHDLRSTYRWTLVE